jgi:hypothetical protein
MVDLAEKALATYFDELEGAWYEGEETGEEKKAHEVLEMINDGYSMDAIAKALKSKLHLN